MDHYRCVRCYFPTTQSEKDCDNVKFFPTTIPFPKVTLTDFLKQATSDIVTILIQLPSTTTPYLEAEDPVHNALMTLATQLKRIDNIPTDTAALSIPPRMPKPSLVPTPHLQ